MPGTPPTSPRLGLPRFAMGDPDQVPIDLTAVVDGVDAKAAVFLSGLAASRPAAGIAERYYYATDTGELTRDTGTAWTTPLNPRSIATVTSLPGAPYDGQIIDYLADTTLGILWRFRYRAASASAFKWEAVGEQPALRSEAAGGQIITTTYTDLPATASVNVPLAGDYVIGFGATEMHNNTANISNFLAPKLGAAATADADSAQSWSTTVNAPVPVWREIRRSGLAAAATVKLQARVSGSTGLTVTNPTLAVRPARVG